MHTDTLNGKVWARYNHLNKRDCTTNICNAHQMLSVKMLMLVSPFISKYHLYILYINIHKAKRTTHV